MITCLTDSTDFIYEILQKSVKHLVSKDSKAFSITCNKSRSACLSLFIPVHGSFSTTLRQINKTDLYSCTATDFV